MQKLEKKLLGINPYKVPDEIIDAINEDKLVVFLGAGISTLYGLPKWSELADGLADWCEGKFGLNDFHDSLEKMDNREKISAVYGICELNGEESLFFEQMKERLGRNISYSKIQNIKNFLFYTNTILTTNADKGIEDLYFDDQNQNEHCRSLYWHPKEFKNIDFDRPSLVYLHGSIRDNDSLVFTIPQYAERYSDKDYTTFLN